MDQRAVVGSEHDLPLMQRPVETGARRLAAGKPGLHGGVEPGLSPPLNVVLRMQVGALDTLTGACSKIVLDPWG